MSPVRSSAKYNAPDDNESARERKCKPVNVPEKCKTSHDKQLRPSQAENRQRPTHENQTVPEPSKTVPTAKPAQIAVMYGTHDSRAHVYNARRTTKKTVSEPKPAYVLCEKRTHALQICTNTQFLVKKREIPVRTNPPQPRSPPRGRPKFPTMTYAEQGNTPRG